MDSYTAEDFATTLLDGAGTILPYVGAGVAAALALVMIFMGIRIGIRFFRVVVRGGNYDNDGNWSGKVGELNDYEKSKS